MPKMRGVSCFLLFLIRGDAVLPFSLGVTLAHMLNPKTCVTLDMLVVFTNGSFFGGRLPGNGRVMPYWSEEAREKG